MAATATHDVIQELKTNSRIGVSRPQVGPFNSGVTKLAADGWRDLGAMNPGSANYDMPKEIYETDTGVPVTTKSRDIIRWSATISFELYDYTSHAIQQIIGTTEQTQYIAAIAPNDFAGVIDAAPGADRNILVIAVANDIDPVAPEEGLNIGETVAVTLGTAGVAGGTWIEAGKIIERDTTANTVTVEGEGFSRVPDAGAAVFKVEREDTIIGGNEIADKKFRTITSLTNGEMFLMYVPKGNFVEGFTPNFADGQSAVMLPGAFSAIGVPQLTPCNPTVKQVVVAEHSFIRKLGVPPAGC
jgi:hypothetical protein